MNKFKYIILSAVSALILGSCNGFLDQTPDQIYTNDEMFGDANMIKSILANMYGRVTYGQSIFDDYSFTYIDEAAKCDGGPDYRSTFEDDLWRTYDYEFVRNVNQFLQGLKETKVLNDEEKKPLEGEVRFLRAWCYFNMCRSLGGVPLMGDSVYTYTSPASLSSLLKPRTTEAATYDYIISECEAAASLLPSATQTHSARANKWAAEMLEARAAIYAASLANYNNKMSNPIKTAGGEVGIPANLAEKYYEKALSIATDVINKSPYKLQDNYANNKAQNFYEATSIKDNNTEVIWARDCKYPGQTNGFTKDNLPKSVAEDIDNSYAGPTLNLVEQFEPIDTDTPGEGSKIVTTEGETYKFYNSADGPFASRDPRLWGSVIYPSASFKGNSIMLQAGQLVKENSNWVLKTGSLDSEENGYILTSVNGPLESNQQYINKTGFYFRKFMDETPSSATRGRGSEMWWPYFRMAEAYMIASEAALELDETEIALTNINAVRTRAGVKPLTTITFNNIVHENEVEFAFEGHRYYDMKRWRLADKVWNGNQNDEGARHRRLWPYRVVAPGDPHNGQWVFVEDFLFMSPNARYFKLQNYYNFFDNDWLNKNPKLVKNPYQ